MHHFYALSLMLKVKRTEEARASLALPSIFLCSFCFVFTELIIFFCCFENFRMVLQECGMFITRAVMDLFLSILLIRKHPYMMSARDLELSLVQE